jgi:hypothetical protein
LLEQQKGIQGLNGQNGQKSPPPIFGETFSLEPQTFERVFNKTAQLDKSSKEILISSGSPIFFDDPKNNFKSGLNFTFSEGEEKIEKRTERPSSQKIIDKRSKRKGFSVALAKSMIEYAKKNKSYMLHTYYRALNCCDTLIQADGKLKTKYCKTRICVICGAIRTAKAIEVYLPEIRGWKAYLVTLTIPNVKESILRRTVDEILDKFRGCQRAIKRKLRFKGVRKIEITYNPTRNDYHVHLHCIVDGLTPAQWLREEWMKRNPGASHAGQDVRRCNKRTLKEVFKYSMKILASGEDENKDPHLYPHAIDAIVKALHKRRTYQNFGFKLPKEFDEDDFDGQALASPDGNIETMAVWTWIHEIHNWVNKATGELLSQYKPSKRRLTFLKKIDTS